MLSNHNINQHNKRNFEDNFKQATKVGKWRREIEVDKNNFLQRLCRSLWRNVLQCENSCSSISVQSSVASSCRCTSTHFASLTNTPSWGSFSSIFCLYSSFVIIKYTGKYSSAFLVHTIYFNFGTRWMWIYNNQREILTFHNFMKCLAINLFFSYPLLEKN